MAAGLAAARVRRQASIWAALLTVSIPTMTWASGAEIAYLAWTEGFWQAWVMDEKGNSAQQITRSASDKTRVSWFPDGSRVLVSGNDGKTVEADIRTGHETAVPLEQTPILDAVVSPDGQQIAYSFGTAIDGNDIWIANRDGSGVHKLIKQAALQHEPAWSPDGAYVYFLSGDGGQAHDIWRTRVSDQASEQLTVGALYHFDVAVAANGTLAYSSNRDGNYEVYVQTPGNSPQRLTNDPALDARPGFSPNGKALAFESTRSGLPQVWVIDLATKNLRRLTNHERGARAPVWWSGEHRR